MIRPALWLALMLLHVVASADTMSIAGDWKFRPGDDPSWSAVDLDDSGWSERTLPSAWTGDGYPESDQRAWYRLRIDIGSIASGDGPIGIRIGAVRNAYQLYVGGRLLGGVGRLPPDAQVNYDRERVYPIDPALIGPDGELVVALRVWGGSDLAVKRSGGGPYAGRFEVGDYATLLRDLDAEQTPKLIFASLFLLVGLYFLYLFATNRALLSFFWFGATALVLAPYIVTQSQWKYELHIPFVVMEKIESVTFFLFLVLNVQLFWSVLQRPSNWLLRAWQGYFLVLALAIAVVPGLGLHYVLRPFWQYGAVAVALPLIVLVVVDAVRGNRDARTLLFGLIVFHLAAFNDLLVNMNVVGSFRLIGFGFLAVLASMGVILAGRFNALLDRLELQVAERTAELSRVNDELEDANRSLQMSSRLDPLTGLLNRRGFSEEAETERQRFLRHREPVGLLIGDVDHFKSFNDSWGHACGDLVLRDVASLLQGHVREIDRVGRWGGEEFVVLLPDTDADGVRRVGEKIRAAIEAHRVQYEGSALQVTITLGGAVLGEGEGIESCIARADAALYTGKENGRNRVELAV